MQTSSTVRRLSGLGLVVVAVTAAGCGSTGTKASTHKAAPVKPTLPLPNLVRETGWQYVSPPEQDNGVEYARYCDRTTGIQFLIGSANYGGSPSTVQDGTCPKADVAAGNSLH